MPTTHHFDGLKFSGALPLNEFLQINNELHLSADPAASGYTFAPLLQINADRPGTVRARLVLLAPVRAVLMRAACAHWRRR